MIFFFFFFAACFVRTSLALALLLRRTNETALFSWYFALCIPVVILHNFGILSSSFHFVGVLFCFVALAWIEVQELFATSDQNFRQTKHSSNGLTFSGK